MWGIVRRQRQTGGCLWGGGTDGKVQGRKLGVSGGTVFAGGGTEVFFEEFAEMVSVFVAYHGGDGLDAQVRGGFHEVAGFFHAEFDQIVDGGVSGLGFEDLGEVKGAEIHVFGYLVEGYFFVVVFVEVADHLFYYVFFVR